MRTCPECGSPNLVVTVLVDHTYKQKPDAAWTDCGADDRYGEGADWRCVDCNNHWKSWLDENVDEVEYP